MSKPHTAKDERRARLAEIRDKQQRAERKRNRLIIICSVAVAIALIVPAAIVIGNEQSRQDRVAEQANAPIDGVAEFTDLSATHVRTEVDYAQSPPVGGDHNQVWQNCAFYTEPVVNEHAVHSLEHGAVWITYDAALPTAELDALRALAKANPYLLVSPYEGLPSPLVASAWGLQLELDSTADERLEVFLSKYLQGPQTLEPGAACSGGIGA